MTLIVCRQLPLRIVTAGCLDTNFSTHASEAHQTTLKDGRISCYNASSVPDYLCPPDVVKLRLEHETSCNRYYVCENGKATEMSCPKRRFFNRHTQTCGRSKRPCRTNARVLIQHVTECQHDGRAGTAVHQGDVCRRVFVPYPNAGNATGVLVCNGDGSAFLAHCPVTFTGIQTVFANGKCRVRQVMRGRHKWEKLLRSPGRYPPDTVRIDRTAHSRAGIRPLDSSSERSRRVGHVETV
uniref:Chitin-binding type-2 domain-containing protein n=1 Tax=Anopheles maculatus TaxID=74869 RepID=A0A182SEA5_9DIPT